MVAIGNYDARDQNVCCKRPTSKTWGQGKYNYVTKNTAAVCCP